MLKAQHSVVSPDTLLRVIQRYYPAISAKQCELMELGCNDTYKLHGKRRNYAFRLYRKDWWPEKEIDEELRLLDALHRHKVNVCKPIRAKNKNRYIKLNAAEGLRFGALFTFLPGRHLGNRFGKRNTNMVHLGELLARIHDTTDSLKQPVQRWTMDFNSMVHPFLEHAHVVLGHREKDIKYLYQLASQLEDIILNQSDDAFDIGVCHGDFHLHNVMLQPDGTLAIFDFDWCGYSWRAYDIATIWWSLARRKCTMPPWQAFLRGYVKQRKLTRQEKALMPWFVVLRHFEYLNFQLSMRKHIGTSWLSDDYYDFHIQFFNNWMKQQLK